LRYHDLSQDPVGDNPDFLGDDAERDDEEGAGWYVTSDADECVVQSKNAMQTVCQQPDD
jgi:hypothetical protein